MTMRSDETIAIRPAAEDHSGDRLGGQGAGAAIERPHPSARSASGLDWFTFFVADVQTGFGPFIAVYLTSHKWTQTDIGLVLSIGGLVALLGQMPGGALVDAARSVRLAAAAAMILISASALVLALWPSFPLVFAASIVHAAASCVLGPAIVAVSLGLVGHAAISERLGRNARFMSVGNALAAAAMGACGYFFSNRSVFYITAVLGAPAIWAIMRIRASEIDAVRAHAGVPRRHPANLASGLRRLAGNGALFVLAAGTALFHLANAAMLPLASSAVTKDAGQWATLLVAACIVVPQAIVAIISPWIGRKAQDWGRRPVLLIGFAALPLRGVLFALTSHPLLLVAIQVLDGISAAVLGVLVPVVIADVTRRTGRFNLAQGAVGTAVGIGASLSTTIGGYLADRFGDPLAFLGLAAAGVCALLVIGAFLRETRDIGA
jgi:MFS family permease